MSGTARRIFSPSSVRIRRNVVCVAGCCGPKFSVYKYSLSTSFSASRDSACSRGMIHLGRPRDFRPWALALRTRNGREVMPLAQPAERVILSQWERRKFFRQQDSPQVWMTFKHDAVHVEHFAL